jgi:hypothetical protein
MRPISKTNARVLEGRGLEMDWSVHHQDTKAPGEEVESERG